LVVTEALKEKLRVGKPYDDLRNTDVGYSMRSAIIENYGTDPEEFCEEMLAGKLSTREATAEFIADVDKITKYLTVAFMAETVPNRTTSLEMFRAANGEGSERNIKLYDMGDPGGLYLGCAMENTKNMHHDADRMPVRFTTGSLGTLIVLHLAYLKKPYAIVVASNNTTDGGHNGVTREDRQFNNARQIMAEINEHFCFWNGKRQLAEGISIAWRDTFRTLLGIEISYQDVRHIAQHIIDDKIRKAEEIQQNSTSLAATANAMLGHFVETGAKVYGIEPGAEKNASKAALQSCLIVCRLYLSALNSNLVDIAKNRDEASVTVQPLGILPIVSKQNLVPVGRPKGNFTSGRKLASSALQKRTWSREHAEAGAPMEMEFGAEHSAWGGREQVEASSEMTCPSANLVSGHGQHSSSSNAAASGDCNYDMEDQTDKILLAMARLSALNPGQETPKRCKNEEQYLLFKHMIDNKKDLMAILRTNTGKSLPYQALSLIEDGVTVLFCTLKSAGEEQEHTLRRWHIPCVRYKSGPRHTTVTEAATAGVLIVQIEHSDTEHFKQLFSCLVNQNRIRRMVVDESHIIHDHRGFRDTMKGVRNLKMRHQVQLVTLTATAPPQFVKEMMASTGMQPNSTVVLRRSVNRPELKYSVTRRTWDRATNKDGNNYIDVRETVKSWNLIEKQASGVVFCPTVAMTRNVLSCLLALPAGYEVVMWTSCMDDDVKRKNLQTWHTKKVSVLVSTSGTMEGLNHPRIAGVAFVGYVYGINNVIQGGGRGARSAEVGYCNVDVLVDPYGTWVDTLDREKMRSVNDGNKIRMNMLALEAFFGMGKFVNQAPKCRRLIITTFADADAISCMSDPTCQLCDVCSGKMVQHQPPTVPTMNVEINEPELKVHSQESAFAGRSYATMEHEDEDGEVLRELSFGSQELLPVFDALEMPERYEGTLSCLGLDSGIVEEAEEIEAASRRLFRYESYEQAEEEEKTDPRNDSASQDEFSPITELVRTVKEREEPRQGAWHSAWDDVARTNRMRQEAKGSGSRQSGQMVHRANGNPRSNAGQQRTGFNMKQHRPPKSIIKRVGGPMTLPDGWMTAADKNKAAAVEVRKSNTGNHDEVKNPYANQKRKIDTRSPVALSPATRREPKKKKGGWTNGGGARNKIQRVVVEEAVPGAVVNSPTMPLDCEISFVLRHEACRVGMASATDNERKRHWAARMREVGKQEVGYYMKFRDTFGYGSGKQCCMCAMRGVRSTCENVNACESIKARACFVCLRVGCSIKTCIVKETKKTLFDRCFACLQSKSMHDCDGECGPKCNRRGEDFLLRPVMYHMQLHEGGNKLARILNLMNYQGKAIGKNTEGLENLTKFMDKGVDESVYGKGGTNYMRFAAVWMAIHLQEKEKTKVTTSAWGRPF
jgi:superfamily II DNA helicase RecQ